MTSADVALRILLGALAAYHLVIGIASITSHGGTARMVRVLYGLTLADSPQVAYTVRMLGLYALAFSALLAVAAWSPADHRPIILVAAALQTARAVSRFSSRQTLTLAFGIPAARNRFNAALLLAQAIGLALLAVLL